MDEKRKSRRSDFLDEIQVLNSETGTELGKLRNVTTRGMMVISSIPHTEANNYPVAIILPGPIMGADRVELQATCRWCREDSKAGQYKAGFEFTNLSGSEEEVLMILQTEYEMHVSLTHK